MRRILFLLSLIFLLSLPAASAKKHPGRLEILVDASASMASPFGSDGSDRLGAIRNSLDILFPALREEQPERKFALRVFGGKILLGETDACNDTRLLLNWSPAEESSLNSLLDGVSSRGASALGAALEAVREDFGNIEEDDGLLILLDGLDSCREDALAPLDDMQEQGLKVLVLGLGLSLDDRREIAAHAPLKNISDFNGFVATLLETITGLSAAETAGLSTEFLLEENQGASSLKLSTTMIPGIKTIQAGDFPLKVPVPAGSLSATALDAEDEVIGTVLRVPVLPGHELILKIPHEPPAELEAGKMEEGWNIQASLELHFSGIPKEGARLVLQKDPSPGASWISAFPVSGPEGRLVLPLPEHSGDYQIQLRVRRDYGEVVLAELKLKPPGHWVSIEAPTEWRSDSSIPIEWKSMAAPGDFLTIVPADSAYESIGAQYPASEGLSFDLPPVEVQCLWEIRYFSGLSNMSLARARVEIQDPPAGLLIPDEAEVSREIRIRFFGPRGKGDMISLAPEGAEADEYISWAGVESDPCRLEAPDQPGAYLIRYLDTEGKILAEEPIEIRESRVVLQVPESAHTGGRIEISWEGERSAEDFIALAREGAPLSRKIAFVYVSMGSPTSLAAPGRKGIYEIRYISQGEILAARKIRVE